MFKLKKSELYKVIFFTFIFVLPKWFFSYFYFDEDISSRIIYEIEGDGEFYLPFIKYLSELNFSNSFNPEIEDIKLMPIPIGSLFLHSLFYLFIKEYSVIFLEIVYVFLFIYIFCLIQKNYFKNINVIPISLIVIIFPSILIISGLNQFDYLNVLSKNFFNLRLHRPIATTIFLLYFLILNLLFYLPPFVLQYL